MNHKLQRGTTCAPHSMIARVSLTIAILTILIPGRLLAQAGTFSSLTIDNQTTNPNTGQMPLSLGNLYNNVNTTLFNFYTLDNGTGYLSMYTPRYGTSILFSRGDPSNNTTSVMGINGTSTVGGYITLYNTSNQGSVVLNSQGATYFTGGSVLIGKSSQSNSSYLLDVNGNARVNEVVVNTSGADYVFDPGYPLKPLADLETYIRKEHHLPGIAPAVKMRQDGVKLGDNQTRLLAKVEELTVYIIQQDKETQKLKEKIKTLEDLQSRIERLEHAIAH